MANIFKSMLSSIIAKTMKNKLLNMTICEDDITETLKQIRLILLDADVNLLVVKNFIKNVRTKAIGYVMNNNEQPDKVVLKIVKEELTSILGKHKKEIDLNNKTTKIMLVGLNGVGKTTTIAKLANLFKTKMQKNPLIVALDVYRPAAIEQLEQLAKKINVVCYKESNSKNVLQIAKNGLDEATKDNNNVVLFDTAGRLQTNEKLMDELKQIKHLTKPDEIFLVVDAMSGQDIVNVAKKFNDYLNITGLIITKFDSNTKGGAVLSIINMLNIPVVFVGNGENINALEQFYPERIADKILGLGDIMTLIDKASENIDESATKKSITRIFSGKFDLEDLLTQMEQISKIGSLSGIMKMLPTSMINKISDNQIEDVENKIKIWKILLNSMTLKERRSPNLFKKEPNRKIRVINGSGRKPDELNKLLSQWSEGKKKMDDIGKKLRSGNNPFLDMLKGKI